MNRSDLRIALEIAQLRGGSVGVVYLDLDRFHQVNTRWGQAVGDRVLDLIGARLTDVLPATSAVATAEGDAFLVVLPDCDATVTRALAEAMVATVREPIAMGSVMLTVAASAGFSAQQDSDHPADLVEQAYLACRRAKASVRGSVVEYELALGADSARHQRTEDGLRQAIDGNELRLHLQPTVDLRDGRIVGVEALVRWMHPTDGLLAPADFLPGAEAAGLMVAIGDWVLQQTIDLVGRWRTSRRGKPMRVWVNLAAQQLADGDHLCNRVRAAIDDGSITARDIGFEVTESSLLEDLPSAVGVLSTLREMGVEIALDDFGTGYSSLSYLRQLPVTAVKVDRSFVAGLGGSLTDEAIVEAVIDLAHALGLRVVAEGIEELAQAEALIRMGADEAQGYHFGRPEPVEMIEPMLGVAWGGSIAPTPLSGKSVDRRADDLPGYGSPRARLLLAALDTAHDSIIVTASGSVGDAWPDIVYVNAAFEAETGHRSIDVIGRSTRFLLGDDVDADVIDWFEQTYRSARAATTEVANCRADGSVFLCEITLSPISDERGVHTHWLHVRRDLTQRRAAEGDRARFQGLIEQSTSLVVLCEPDGRWVYANAAQRRAIGIALDAPLDHVTSRSVYDDDQMRQIADEVLPALHTEGTWSGPVVFRNCITGELTHVVSDLQAVEDPLRPGVKFFASVSRDVGELIAMEENARRRRELGSFASNLAQRALDLGRNELFADIDAVLGSLGELFDADLVYLDTIDLDRNMLTPIGGWTSPRYTKRSAPPAQISLDALPSWIERLHTSGVLIGSKMLDFEPPQPWAVELAGVFPGQPVGVNMYAPLRVGGVLLGVLGIASLDDDRVFGEDEVVTVQQVAEALANLLHRQRAENALLASEGYLTSMLANLADILLVIDDEGWVRYVNLRVEDSLGYRRDDVIGAHFLTLVHPEDQTIAMESFVRTLSGDGELPVTELRVVHCDGSSTWFDADTSGVFDPVLGGYVVSLRNVSVQRATLDSADRRAEFEGVVLSLSKWALAVETDEILGGLDKHLEHLGRVLNCDSAFAALLEDDRVHNVAGWSADDAPPLVYQLPEETTRFPAIAARYRTLQPFVVADITLHDEDWADEWRSFPVSDRSGLNMPLVSEGRCLGNLGVAMSTTARDWQADEIALVERVSETVASVLARQRIEAELRMSETRLAALLNGSSDMLVVLGMDGTVLYANGAVQRSLGYSPEELVGMNVASVVHPDDLELGMARLRALLTGVPTDHATNGTTSGTTVRLQAADGTVGSWEITSGQMRDPIAGGRVLTCRDITQRLARESEHATRVQHLRYAFEVAQSALDVEAGEFLASLPSVCTALADMLGVDFVYVDQLDERRGLLQNLAGLVSNGSVQSVEPGETLQFSLLPQWIDRLRRPEPIVERNALACNEPWAVEKRAVMGSEGGLVAVGMSSAGELFGVLGVSMHTSPRDWSDDEVTLLRIVAETIAHVLERSRIDDALRASEARFRSLSETAADVVMLLDADRCIVYASPSSIGLLGYTPDELIGRTARSLVHPDDLDDMIAAGPRLRTGDAVTIEARLVRADGSAVWVENSTSSVLDPATGEPVEYRSSVRDITDRKRLEAELEHRALHDPLTGLGNRILLGNRLTIAASSDGSPSELAVLLIDLDGFKEVNDTYGHAVGDDVLRIVSARLSGITRPTDTLARTGGDEFVVLCPDTDIEAALVVGERIVEAVGQPLSTNGITVRLGASVGVAHHIGSGIDPDGLLIQADHAMYAAKRSGRGRVFVAAAA